MKEKGSKQNTRNKIREYVKRKLRKQYSDLDKFGKKTRKSGLKKLQRQK
jgi:hypothetical protein